MTTILKHKGTPVEFSVGILLVPPLSLAFIEENAERIGSFGASGDLADSKLVIDCLHGALVRNYPAITRADVADLVDLGNMEEVMLAVMQRSGLVSAKEAGDAGKLVVTTL